MALKRVSASVTRPANTTQYTAGDVLGDATTGVLTLSDGLTYSTGGALVRNILISKSTSTVTLFTTRVHFYNDQPTAIADNAAWTLLHADAAKYLGYRDLDIAVSPGSGNGAVAQMAATNVPLPLIGATGEGRALYAVIALVGAYTPASAEEFTLTVLLEQV